MAQLPFFHCDSFTAVMESYNCRRPSLQHHRINHIIIELLSGMWFINLVKFIKLSNISKSPESIDYVDKNCG